MIKYRVLLAAGHEGETCQVRQHSRGAILAIEPQQGVRLGQMVRREVARDGRQALAQLLAVATVAAIAKRTEPLVRMSLADDRARPHHLLALAPGVASRIDLIQSAKGRGQVVTLG